MALIDDVKKICDRLAPHGWAALLRQFGLDITAADLKQELAKELQLTAAKRQAQGFEDFALEGRRGIEPGHPARSLLYHALASPNVLTGVGGSALQEFPTLAEIDTVENYVYGVQPPTLQELRARAQDAPLAVVVFASQYRPAPHTCHKKHADLVFSRTGIARVGTAAPAYDARRRGFVPFVDGNPFAIRVLPARYAAYIAVQQNGDEANACPMRFRDTSDAEDRVSDADRKFWLPLHKLFPGSECLRGLPQDLQVDLTAHHCNEKIRRIHIELGKRVDVSGNPFDTGAREQDLDKSPFRFEEGIAELSTDPQFGAGTLMPAVHPRLVEPAEFGGNPLTFNVPPNGDTLSSSFSISGAENGPRHAPEFVHARRRVEATGTLTDLNEKTDVEGLVKSGGYKVLHFVDFTGDGWIAASCPPLTGPGSD
jgi:hypothetical protein